MAMSRQNVMPTGILIRQTAMACGALLAIPLFVYPRSFGFPSMELNPAFALIEWLFYFGVFTVAGMRMTASSRVVTAGFTVLCRLIVGAALGTMISFAHNKPWLIAVNEMLWSYPVAMFIHVLFVPIMMRPIWERMMGDNRLERRRRPQQRAKVVTRRPIVSRPAKTTYGSRTAMATEGTITSVESSKSAASVLDNAVSYIGDYHGVRMCWIVDGEGLPLAVWQRQQYSGDADFWAPVSVEAAEFHRRRLSVSGACIPERIEVRTDLGRVIIEAVGAYWLGVLTDSETDDLISVRIGRARDMVANYLQEAGRRFVGAGEASYV